VTIPGDSLLNVADLAVTFDSQEGTVRAVDGVSFAIQPGETVGLVGESGCGKSISALAILGLVRMMSNSIVSGSVEFMGRDLLALPESAVRSVRGRDMAMIFQDPVTSLNPVLSIERQMTEGIENHLGLSTATPSSARSSCSRRSASPRPRSACATTPTSSRAACVSA